MYMCTYMYSNLPTQSVVAGTSTSHLYLQANNYNHLLLITCRPSSITTCTWQQFVHVFQDLKQSPLLKFQEDPCVRSLTITELQMYNYEFKHSTPPTRTPQVTCFDWDSDGSHDLIGEFTTSLAEMSGGSVKSWPCINPKKLSKKKYQNSGTVRLERITVSGYHSEWAAV